MTDFGFDGEFTGPSTFQTTSIALNTGSPIVNAKIVIDIAALSTPTAFDWFLTADGGATWNLVDANAWFVFPTPGNDLRLRIIAPPGEVISIRSASGEDRPIKVIYNE